MLVEYHTGYIYTVHGISNIYRVGFRQKYNIYSISLIVLSYGLSETMGNSEAGERRCPCRYWVYIFSVIAIHLHSILSLSLDIFDYHLNPLMKKLYYLWNVPRLIKLLFIWLYLYPADPVHGLQHEYCQEFWARCHHELLGVPLGKSSHDINIRII